MATSPPTLQPPQFRPQSAYLQPNTVNQQAVTTTVTNPLNQNINATYYTSGYVENAPAGQTVFLNRQTEIPIARNTVTQTVYSNQLNTQGPFVATGSQVNRGTYQTVASQSAAKRDTIQVFRADGPPLPPLQASSWRQSQSMVRPLSLDPLVEKKVVYVDEPMKVSSHRPAQAQTIYETVVTEKHDPVRESRKALYEGKGYADSARASPCCLALLGLLALAGLLTGLFFLIRAINAGAGGSAPARTAVEYKQTNGTHNSTGNSSIIIPSANSSSATAVVIDNHTNPSTGSTTVTPTIITNTTSVTGNNTTSVIGNTNKTSGSSTNTTTVSTANSTTNTNTNTNTITTGTSGTSGSTIYPTTTVSGTTTTNTNNNQGTSAISTTPSTSTTTNTVNPTKNNTTTTTTTNTISTTTPTTTTTTTTVPNTNTNTNTNTGSTTPTTSPTSTTSTTTPTSTTGTTGTTPTSTTGTTSPTSSTTTTTTTTTTNTIPTVAPAPIAPTTIVPETATILTTQQILTDRNTQKIDSFLRTEDAVRLGTNPVLKNVAVNDANGTRTYYYYYDTGSGKKYLYGVVIGSDGQPVVKTVTVQAEPTPTPAHLLGEPSSRKHVRVGHKLHAQTNLK